MKKFKGDMAMKLNS